MPRRVCDEERLLNLSFPLEFEHFLETSLHVFRPVAAAFSDTGLDDGLHSLSGGERLDDETHVVGDVTVADEGAADLEVLVGCTDCVDDVD